LKCSHTRGRRQLCGHPEDGARALAVRRRAQSVPACCSPLDRFLRGRNVSTESTGRKIPPGAMRSSGEFVKTVARNTVALSAGGTVAGDSAPSSSPAAKSSDPVELTSRVDRQPTSVYCRRGSPHTQTSSRRFFNLVEEGSSIDSCGETAVSLRSTRGLLKREQLTIPSTAGERAVVEDELEALPTIREKKR